MLDVVAHPGDFLLYGQNLLVHGLGVELGDFAHRLLHELQYVVHDYLPAEQVLIALHVAEHVGELGVPVLLVLFQHLVDAVLEEYALQGAVVPFAFELVEPDVQLPEQQLTGVEGAVFQDVVDRQELRLVVPDHAGVGRKVEFAVRERVERVYGLVRGDVVGQMDHDVHLVGGHVLYFLDFDLALLLGLQDGLDYVLGVFAVGDFGDGYRVLVDFLDTGAHLHAAAPLSGHVLAAVGEAAGGEVGVDFVAAALEYGHGGVDELVEVVRENLRGQSDSDALGALREQEGEAHRQLYGLAVPSVVGGHPFRDLRVEDHFLGEPGQPRLDVSSCGVGVAGEDVSPVSLAVDGEALLAQLDQGPEYRRVAVGMELHGLSDYVRDLGVFAVVHVEHGVENPALHWLEAVHDVRHGTMQDYV